MTEKRQDGSITTQRRRLEPDNPYVLRPMSQALAAALT